MHNHVFVIYEPDVIQFVVDKGNNSTAQGDPKPLAALLISIHNFSSEHRRLVYRLAASNKTASIKYNTF
jgi:hypothetical protein